MEIKLIDTCELSLANNLTYEKERYEKLSVTQKAKIIQYIPCEVIRQKGKWIIVGNSELYHIAKEYYFLKVRCVVVKTQKPQERNYKITVEKSE